MNEEPVALDEILSSHVTGAEIEWAGATCWYKGVEIISMFGSEKPTAVWVRTKMPDNRDKWLKVTDPDFFEVFDAAIIYAKKIVEETIETERALNALRRRVFDGSL